MEAPRIALAQMNPVTGDLDGNAARIADLCGQAAGSGAGLVLFPELALSGYGADDLFTRPDFLAAAHSLIGELAPRIGDVTALIGYPEPAGPPEGGLPAAASSVAVLAGGAVSGTYRKRLLSRAAGVDQPARFRPGAAGLGLNVGGIKTTVLAGEEFMAVDRGLPAGGLIAISGASPYVRGSARRREGLLVEAARSRRAWVALCDHAGGQDELIFEGASSLVSPEGKVVARAGQFSEELLICRPEAIVPSWLGDIEELYRALVAGIRDYATKNGFERIGLGLSGGLDSALVAALAVDALGPERVGTVVMPSPHSTGETQADAREMASRLGCEQIELPIEDLMSAYVGLLGNDVSGIAAENLQARIRATLLMTLSNSREWLILATSNRSEAAVGYATLYGDMTGSLAPIQDVPKTVAYELARYRNEVDPVIPQSIIERAPSAELRPDQKDSDALPDYPELDRILGLYLDQGLGPAAIVRRGEDAETVAEVISLVDRSEYKRHQAPPGLRVSPTSFTRDRRMPLTSAFSPGR